MRIRFKSTQGGENGFKIRQEYDMDEKSAQHWIKLGHAVRVDDAKASRPVAQPAPANEQNKT